MAMTVVVGAGLAGLSAAWELSRAGIEVMVLESERRAGGMVVSERRDGFIIEGGPDSWLAAEPEIPALAEELGIAGEIVAQEARGSWLWTGSALERLDEGRAAALLGIQAKGPELAAGFRSFSRGMGSLIEALLDRLGPRTVVRSPLGVTALTPDGNHWRLAVTGGAMIEADAVVLALPAYSAGRLLEQAGVHGARELGEVTYFPSTTVSLAYRADQVGRQLDGTGFVAAAEAPGTVRACTYASQKFPGRSPQGHVLLRAFVSAGDRDTASAAHDDLTPILELRGEPLWSRTFAWAKGIPRYGTGHAERVVVVRRRLERLSPVAIAGAGYDGAGVSACVRSGRQAGRDVASRLASATIRSTVSPNS